MKTLSTLLSFICFANGLFAQYDGNLGYTTFKPFFYISPNTDSVIRKNHITRELIYTYQLRGGKLQDSLLACVIFYNENGKPTEKWITSEADKIIEKYSYRYDSVNQSMKLTMTPDPGIPDAEVVEIEYDSLGRELNMYVFNSDTTSLIIRHKKYDSVGRLKTLYTSINDSAFYRSNTYSYTIGGWLKEFGQFDKQGQLEFQFVYKYDTAKRVEKIFKKYTQGSYMVFENAYDNRQRPVNITPKGYTQTVSGSVAANSSVDPYSGQYLYESPGSLTIATWAPHRYMTYNADDTFFECAVRNGNRKSVAIDMVRHYYLHE